MALTERLVRYGGARLSRRMTRAMPIVGVVVAVATLAATMKKKGFFRGALDTGLNAMPVIGAAKTAIEMVRGQDFFADRPTLAANQSDPRPSGGRRTRTRSDR